jgi:hypothetical protein
MKSASGMLWARAPITIAFLPSRFPATSSPIQAPTAMWVNESILFSVAKKQQFLGI